MGCHCLKSDMVDVIDAEPSIIIEVRVPRIKVRRRSGNQPW